MLDRTDAENEVIREKNHIMTAGDDIPPPIPEFRASHAADPVHRDGVRIDVDFSGHQDMKLPKPLLDHLKGKKILTPSPIQMQGLPVA